MDKKKVLIFYASYGGGHFSAAKAIKQFIDENYENCETLMVDCVEYISKFLNSFTTAAYREMAKKAPWAWEKVYYKSQDGMLAKVSTTSNKLMAMRIAKLFREFQPDVVISTHPFGSQMTSYLKKKERTSCKLACIMTDFAPHDQWLVGSEHIDGFFVSNDDMKEKMLLQHIPNEKIFVTGIPISKKFSQDFNKKEIYSQFSFDPNKKSILFFGGGEFGLGKEKTVEILRALASFDLPIQVVAVAGKNEKMKSAFEQVVKENNKEDSIKVLSFTDKVPELMYISDLIITKPGGLTTSESLVSGLPIVVINPLPGQEDENSNFLEEHGCAIRIRTQDNAKNVLYSLLSDEERLENFRNNSRKMAKKFATKDICEIILKMERN